MDDRPPLRPYAYDHADFARTFSEPSPDLSVNPCGLGLLIAVFQARQFRPTVWSLATIVIAGWGVIIAGFGLGLISPWLAVTAGIEFGGIYIFVGGMLAAVAVPGYAWNRVDRVVVDLIRRRAVDDPQFFEFARRHDLYTLYYSGEGVDGRSPMLTLLVMTGIVFWFFGIAIAVVLRLVVT